MKAWKFYKDRAGDYLVVRNRPLRDDIHDAVAPERRGKPASVDLTVVNQRYLARCTEVAEALVPDDWHEALVGAI
jgi:hypothetical protein